ncbi:M28 family peptidase [Chitinophaga qingshengii]|uniref:M28 family peptidase n=1 Tax=Chitinophaga qingshengii TaxID=1569794 RepID=A0ABR7TM09_9BACT|nr:M28 family peptidase [Chitinophaga qingshengii]
MKKITWLLPLVCTTLFVDAQKKSDRKTLSNLQTHVTYLCSDKLEGRQTGAPGEQLAAAYLSSQLEQIGISPKGDNGFLQTFTIREGREPDNCTLTLNHEKLVSGKQFIPLPFSAGKNAKGEVLPAVNEPDNIWLINAAEIEADPHKSNMGQYLRETQVAAKSGASAVIFYNGRETPEEVNSWHKQNVKSTSIPAVWVNSDISRILAKDDANAFQIDMKVAFKPVKITGTNVIGFIDNKAPKTVIIGAHYDHLGKGGGADDNASGTAALLELARMLKSGRFKNHNFVIIAFSGKEEGLAGSSWFTTHSEGIDLSQVNYMINLDIVGDLNAARGLQIGGTSSYTGWPEVIGSVAAKDIRVVYDANNTSESDHTSFYKKNIPVLYFYTNAHKSIPEAEDNPDKINYDGTLTVIKLVYDIISKTDNMEKLAFNSTTASK